MRNSALRLHIITAPFAEPYKILCRLDSERLAYFAHSAYLFISIVDGLDLQIELLELNSAERNEYMTSELHLFW